MRVLAIGCGSIGARRARLLAEMGHEVGVVDADLSRVLGVFDSLVGVGPAPMDRSPYVWSPRLDLALAYPPDAAFICTPARTHIELAREVVASGCRALFIEKPLSTSMDGVAELVEECERRGVVTMGACNMRWAYRDIPRLPPGTHLLLRTEGPLSGWRAGAREAYVAAGIVLESAIHDLDLAVWLNGPVIELDAEGGEDDVLVTLGHANDSVSTIVSDWREGVRPFRRAVVGVPVARGFAPDTSDEMYRKEMAHFLRAASGEEPPTNPLRQAAETLRWALHARDLTRKVAA